jgi:colicin import membrane protein
MAMAVLALSAGVLAPAPARADAEWDAAQRTVRDRIMDAYAALPADGAGQKLAAAAEQAATDPRALAELARAQDEYVTRTLAEWKDGPERKATQDAGAQLQKSADRAAAELRAAREAADSAAIRMRHSGVFGKVGRVEAAAKDAGARMAALWERDRALREREKEQREREAGERAREQRR